MRRRVVVGRARYRASPRLCLTALLMMSSRVLLIQRMLMRRERAMMLMLWVRSRLWPQWRLWRHLLPPLRQEPPLRRIAVRWMVRRSSLRDPSLRGLLRVKAKEELVRREGGLRRTR